MEQKTISKKSARTMAAFAAAAAIAVSILPVTVTAENEAYSADSAAVENADEALGAYSDEEIVRAAEESGVSGDFEYIILGSNAVITKYNGTGGSVVIPSSVGVCKVTGIGDKVFIDNTDITSVTIPSGVTSIGENTFSGCTNLTSVTFPETLTSIGGWAFLNTGIKEVSLPDGISYVGCEAFRKCAALTKLSFYKTGNAAEDIEWGFVTVYGGGCTFADCTSLVSAQLPDHVTSITHNMFYKCSALTSFTMPKNLGSIGDNAFSECTNLSAVKFNDVLKTIGAHAFYNTSIKELSLPDGISYVGCEAFRKCAALTKLSFYKTSNTAADIEWGYVTAYGGGCTFADCTSLVSAQLPDHVTSITHNMFYKCSALTSFTMPKNLGSIGDNAFSECNNLSAVKFNDVLKTIGEHAFYKTSIKELSLPEGISYIGCEAFKMCTALTKLSFYKTGYTADDIEWGYVTAYGGGCTFADCTSLVSAQLPDYVKNITHNLFNKCTSLTSFTMPMNLETIGDKAFYGCTNLSEVKFNDKLKKIGGEAFSDSGIKNAFLPEGISYMGYGAFTRCKALTSVAFYKTGYTADDIKWDYVTGYGGGCTFAECPALTSVILPDYLKTMTINMFAGCTSLRSAMLPVSLQTVPKNAFNGCKSYVRTYYKGSPEQYNFTVDEEGNEYFINAGKNYNAEKIYEYNDRLYDIFLNRSAEPTGLADWTSRLISDNATSAEIVYGIANSPEFTMKQYTNDIVVEKMYQAMLDRPSDPAGKASWLNALDSGMTINGIINGFSGSQEFGQICTGYGIQAGSVSNVEPRDKSAGLTSFTARMYMKALGRTYDITGLNDWTNRYLTGEAKVRDIAFGFIFSPEFVNKGLSDSDYVDTLYRTFFNREPDEGGKANWMAQLANGTPREVVLDGFVGSQECANLVASFGIG